MKKNYLFFLLLCMQFLSSQFTESDIKFWVGTGSKKAYFIADFNDNNTPASYAWGYRFDDANLTMEDLINGIAAAEPGIEADIPSGFLYSFNYNHHIPSLDDYWSTWSGPDSENMVLNNGVNNDPLVNGKWYGISYGFDPNYTYPSTPVAAYNSAWYSSSQIVNWIGTGNNKSLVVIDFGTNSSNGNTDSFVFGIQYNGSLNAAQALELIKTQAPYFNYTVSGNQIAGLSLHNFSGTPSGQQTWKLYKGKNLSSWKGQTNLSQIQLTNNEWLGLSFGQRLPFTPTEATNNTLGIASAHKKNFKIYPNPATDLIQIDSNENIKEVNIYSVSGQKVLDSQGKKINVQSLEKGIYFVEIKTDHQTIIQKLIKQ